MSAIVPRHGSNEAVPPSAASLQSGGLAWPEAGRVAKKVGPRRINGEASAY